MSIPRDLKNGNLLDPDYLVVKMVGQVCLPELQKRTLRTGPKSSPLGRILHTAKQWLSPQLQ